MRQAIRAICLQIEQLALVDQATLPLDGTLGLEDKPMRFGIFEMDNTMVDRLGVL